MAEASAVLYRLGESQAPASTRCSASGSATLVENVARQVTSTGVDQRTSASIEAHEEGRHEVVRRHVNCKAMVGQIEKTAHVGTSQGKHTQIGTGLYGQQGGT